MLVVTGLSNVRELRLLDCIACLFYVIIPGAITTAFFKLFVMLNEHSMFLCCILLCIELCFYFGQRLQVSNIKLQTWI